MRCFMSNKECEHYPAKKGVLNEVFVISPFGYPFDEVFENVIKQKGEQDLNLNVSRADLALQLGYVMCQRICRKIIESEFIVADISIPNPNVYYEAGLGYSMRKGIVFLANIKMENGYRFGLEDDRCDYYLSYGNIDDIKISEESLLHTDASLPHTTGKRNCLQYARAKPCRLTVKDHSEVRDYMYYSSPNRIVILENSNAPLTDFHSRVFREIIDTKIKKLLASKPYNKSERHNLARFHQKLKSWEIESLEINQHCDLNDLIGAVKRANICIIDTTQYEDKVNPYLFFCLGLAHGFERKVIPITNRQIKTKHPFDTRGLWHIFYQDKAELKDQFLQILPSIFNELETTKDSNLVRQLWDPFLDDKNIQIFTCARNVDDPEFASEYRINGDNYNAFGGGRGKRTNIDKCDYKTVTDFTYFIVQNYPTAKIRFSPPVAKKNSESWRSFIRKTNL